MIVFTMKFPNITLMLSGAIALAMYSYSVRRIRHLFWMPLVTVLSCVGLAITGVWTLPSEWLSTSIFAFTVLVSISAYSIHRTRVGCRDARSRKGALLAGVGHSTVGGFLAGLMIALPLYFLGLFPDNIAFAFPMIGLFGGALIGPILGLIADTLVALENRRKSLLLERENHGVHRSTA